MRFAPATCPIIDRALSNDDDDDDDDDVSVTASSMSSMFSDCRTMPRDQRELPSHMNATCRGSERHDRGRRRGPRLRVVVDDLASTSPSRGTSSHSFDVDDNGAMRRRVPVDAVTGTGGANARRVRRRRMRNDDDDDDDDDAFDIDGHESNIHAARRRAYDAAAAALGMIVAFRRLARIVRRERCYPPPPLPAPPPTQRHLKNLRSARWRDGEAER
jgi:hypothetical protein